MQTMEGGVMPGEYDGYLTEMEGGGWEVAAGGVVLTKHPDEEVARAILAEHGSGRPCWKVRRDGRAERIS
jgi:hypothetical protein